MKVNQIYNEDCLVGMQRLPDNSIDLVLTDPPYGISFMNKKWDYEIPSVEIWQECIRVLKPGGHLLAFAGTRTQHRMAVNIEDAGFEIKDVISYLYGSGFPKSLNVGVAVNKLETKEWSKIGKALDNIDQKSIMEVWKSNSNNVKIVETQSLKKQIIAGQDTPSESFVVLNVVQNSNQESSNLIVSFAEQNLNEAQAINTKTNTALRSVEAEIRQLQNNVKSVEQQPQNQNRNVWNIFTAQCDVKEWLKENTEVNLKVDEALKTLRGNKKYSNEEITNVLYVALTDILKLTILNQSKIFQNLDTNQKTECVYAINVIITEYIAENLISNTVDILKSKAVDKLQGNEREVLGEHPNPAGNKAGGNSLNMSAVGMPETAILTKGTSEWEGWGTALKPAYEPITLARKPLSEKTIAENVLKWGTGGLNIDECRIGTKQTVTNTSYTRKGNEGWQRPSNQTGEQLKKTLNKPGRFPANVIHDGSDEVLAGFPETKSGARKGGDDFKLGRYENQKGAWGLKKGMDCEGSNGSAARFFYCAKASKAERGEGNNHPTVKPLALIQYLLKLASKENYVVLDPFLGSGTTAVACIQNNRNYIGFEIDEGYFSIAKQRIKDAEVQMTLL